MKRCRDPMMDMTEKKATVSDTVKIFYDCPYPGCGVRAHNPHNLTSHVQSHVEKERKKKEIKEKQMK